eukprot:TRINITY_DN113600_c0_g1_i1.p1 TRINITY_DN113600_c0_g1~~TRINITY_DN113600_c0_g1_i1.p1  ORF type:complete len:248 (-),score=16.18 TRINITY_DN113600_c0_g1_i1:30-773(-)
MQPLLVDIEECHELVFSFCQDSITSENFLVQFSQHGHRSDSRLTKFSYLLQKQSKINISPRDVIVEMLSFLSLADVLHVQLVSSSWLGHAMDPLLWKKLFISHFVPSPEDDVAKHALAIAQNFNGRHFYLLCRNATQHNNQQRRYQNTATLGTFTQLVWKFRCPLSWYDLQPTDDPMKRLCACCTMVHQYKTVPDDTLPKCYAVVAVNEEVGSGTECMIDNIEMGIIDEPSTNKQVLNKCCAACHVM